MGLAPLLDARHILGVTKVVAVGRLAQPSLLTGRLAGPTAIGLLAVTLPVVVAVVREEKGAATAALTSFRLQAHREPKPKGLRKELNQNHRTEEAPKGRRKESFHTNSRKKIHGKKKQFQTGGSNAFSF
jgi:hypothetical protein